MSLQWQLAQKLRPGLPLCTVRISFYAWGICVVRMRARAQVKCNAQCAANAALKEG